MDAITSMDAMDDTDEEVDAELIKAFGRFYRVPALARLMDVSVGTLYAAIDSGDLEAISVGGARGALRVGHAKFVDYLNRRNTRARKAL